MSAPAAASSFTWLPAIPVATKPTQAHLDALCKRFSYTPPAALQQLFLSHSGEQIQPSLFWAQNVKNGKWKKESIGPIYPLGSASSLGENEDDDADEYASYSVSIVNEMFEEELEDEDELPQDVSSPANKGVKPKLPFFAFSEAKNSGHLLVIDTRTGNVLLLDVTHRSGPWIVAEDFDDFLKRLTEAANEDKKPGKDGEEEEEEEEEEEGDDAEMAGDDFDEEEEDVYCCDGCMDEITDTRYHCNQCKNYDLCAACKKKADDAASSASSSAKKGKKNADADSHPASHTFTAIESKAGHDEEEDEEEEKSNAKPKKK